MRWTSLFRAHLLQTLRRPWQLFFVIAAVVVALAAGLQGLDAQSNRFAVAVVIEDQGEYGRRMIDSLSGYPNIDLQVLTREEAFTLLRQDRLEGVFVVRPDFTAKLQEGGFGRIVEWYTAPSTRAAATVSEPLITETMRLWLEELAVNGTRRFLEESGILYTVEDELFQRQVIRSTWLVPAQVDVKAYQRDGTAQPGDKPSQLPGSAGPLDDCIRWYAVLCVFYLIISASWVLDINKRGLRLRAVQSGGRMWRILLGSGLAPLMTGFAGYWLTGAACILLTDGSWLRLASLGVPFFVYLGTVLGMTIFLASFLKQPMSLMFMAPLLTFLNALLGGMIASLPDWATVLAILSRALPGRWLISFFDDPVRSLLFALICGACWFMAGVILSEIRQSDRRSAS